MNTIPRRRVFSFLWLVVALLEEFTTTYYDYEDDDTWCGLFGEDRNA